MKIKKTITLTELASVISYANNEIAFWEKSLNKKDLDQDDKEDYQKNLEYWTEVEETASYHIEKMIKLNFIP